MANKYTNLNDLFTGIADAIRSKNNSSAPIVADNFPSEIENLQSGFKCINGNITSISAYAFDSCEEIEYVNCPNLTSIGQCAFRNCRNLKTIVLYDGVTNVEENAFKGCPNVTIYCEATEKSSGWHDNWNPDGCEVVWGFAPVASGDMVSTDGNPVFATLYRNIFTNDNHYYLIIAGGYSGSIISAIESNSMFRQYADKIDFVVIYGLIASIGRNAFSNCSSLQSINISVNILDINNYSFHNCISLQKITIPDSVNSIRNSVFMNCISLQSIIYTGTVSQWSAIAKDTNWDAGTPNYTIYCTDGTIAKDGTVTMY